VAAQTVKDFEIKDQSPDDCPVRISGQIQITETVENDKFKASYIEHFETFNATEKPIIALVTVTGVATSLGPLNEETKLLDAFFSHDLEIGARDKHVHSDRKRSGLFEESFRSEAKLGEPHAESKVVFVQFADGSTWGDINDSRVQRLMSKRALILKTIHFLDYAGSKGDEEFLKALGLDSGDGDVDAVVIYRLREDQKKRGIGYAKGMVKQMLAVAASR